MNTFEERLWGESPEFQALIRTAQVAAATDVTALIHGESGSGKEQLARALHAESRRREAPFVAINCAALPDSEQLAEQELFGYGREDGQQGLLAQAQNGTLLLDEVGELSLILQAKLLRFIESSEKTFNIRFIASSRLNLIDQVKEGLFREDLFYRLNIIPLEIPALRKRSGDVRYLLNRFTDEISQQHGVQAPSFDKAAIKLLEQHSWPGNVRELRNLCERMVILMAGSAISPDNLPQEIRSPVQESGAFILPDEGIILDELEQQMIRQALDKTNGNRSRAARLLGLTRDTLLYRLKKYAIA